MTTTVELRRTPQEVEDARAAEADKQIADARGGLRASVGREAAARYLGKSVSTLNRLNRNGLGPKSTARSSSGSDAQNAGVSYTLADLDAWQAANAGSSYKAAKLARQVLQNDRDIELLLLRARVKEQDELIASLIKKINGKTMALTCLVDLTLPMDWCVADGMMVGSALTVDSDVLAHAIANDGLIELSIEEALRERWVDGAEFGLWADVAGQVLDQERKTLTERLEARNSREAIWKALR